MLQSSVTSKVVLYIWQAFKDSRLFYVLSCITSYFALAYKHSTLRKLLTCASHIENCVQESIFFKILSFIFTGITKLLKNLAAAFYNASRESYISNTALRLSEGSFIFNINNFFPISIMCIFLVPHEMWNNMYALGIALLLCVVYIFCLHKNIGFGSNIKAIPIQLLLFIFSIAVSVVISRDLSDSVRIFIFFVTSYILCFLVYGSIRNESSLISFARIIYFTLLIASAFGLFQSLLGVEADASFTDLELNKDMPGRVFGTMGNPNNYAEYLMIFLPYAFSFAITRKGADSKMLHLVGLILPFAALLTTYSRSSWIALAVACVLYIIIYNYKLIPVFSAGVICALPFIPQSVYNRILTIGNVADSSSAYRITIWTGVVEMMKTRWFTGIGLGPDAFTRVFQNYAIGDTIVARHSHMQLLEMLVEGGVLCLVSYVWLLIVLVKRSCVMAVRAKDDTAKHFCSAAAASICAIAVIGMFEYCWFYPRVMFAFFISVGLCLGILKVFKQK